MQGRPRIAIIDPNTLSALGLKQMLQNVMPIMDVETFGSFLELQANNPESFFHFFVAMNILIENRAFFSERRKKTIVLTLSLDSTSQLSEFNSLCINVPEQELVRSLLSLEQHAHKHGRNLPPMPRVLQQKILTDREIEVMSLIVQGYINKEIAEKLNIALATVITHRKNIMEKLGARSIADIIIYSVVNGFVSIEELKPSMD